MNVHNKKNHQTNTQNSPNIWIQSLQKCVAHTHKANKIDGSPHRSPLLLDKKVKTQLIDQKYNTTIKLINKIRSATNPSPDLRHDVWLCSQAESL